MDQLYNYWSSATGDLPVQEGMARRNRSHIDGHTTVSAAHSAADNLSG